MALFCNADFSDKQAREHGLQSIDLASFVNNKDVFTGCQFDVNNQNLTLNDVCDVLNTEGAVWNLKKLIDRELTTKSMVYTSAYRPVFSNVFQTPIDNYLGDTEGAYLQFKNQIWLSQKGLLRRHAPKKTKSRHTSPMQTPKIQLLPSLILRRRTPKPDSALSPIWAANRCRMKPKVCEKDWVLTRQKTAHRMVRFHRWRRTI